MGSRAIGRLSKLRVVALALLIVVGVSGCSRPDPTRTSDWIKVGTQLDCSRGYVALRKRALAESVGDTGPRLPMWTLYAQRGMYRITQPGHPAHPALYLYADGEMSGCGYGDPAAFDKWLR